MRPATPRARSRWRTNVVLPAPRSPCSAMKARASPRVLRQPPAKASVSASLSQVIRRWRRPAPGWFLQSAGDVGGVLRSTVLRWWLPSGNGAASSDSPKSVSPAWTCRAPRRGCCIGCPTAFTAKWPTWRRTASSAPAGRTGAGHGLGHHRPHGLPAGRHARRLAAGRVGPPGAPRRSHRVALCPRPRLPQGAAQPPAEAGRAHRAESARSGTAPSPTRRRCWRRNWRRAAARAGAASTRWCCAAMPARCSSWARSTSTSRCPRPHPRARTAAPARLHHGLPDRARSWARTGWMRAAASPT
jgi:hypothetical protein